MDVKVFNAEGNAITDQKGELVCVKASTMPIKFWNDKIIKF